MNKFFLWCDANLLNRYTLLLVIVVLCLYKYGYPAYQDYRLSKLEDKVRNNFAEYVIKYEINKPIPPNVSNLEYSSIDLTYYPDVELYYKVKDFSGRYFTGSGKPFKDSAAWLCWFQNYMGIGINGKVHEGDAMRNVLVEDNVKFTHILLNQAGKTVQKFSIEVRQCKR